jgi:hypothetical protein
VCGGDGCGGGVGSLRAIHEVVSSSARPDLEEILSTGGSGLSGWPGLPRGSTQLCHVGWDRKAWFVGRVELLEGLNTSSESREPLVIGGIFDDALSVCSISLHEHHPCRANNSISVEINMQ